jgi:CDP-diacylglycerol--glycerol-3-phosphate 3-phosphatidyltransferase
VWVRLWQRSAFAVARGLMRMKVSPSTVTTVGLCCALLVPLAALLGGGFLFLATALVVVAALADSVDSGVAVLANRTSAAGSFYDSVADRCSELAWLVALWLVGAPGALVAACGALTLLHEYARSRAALAGMPKVAAGTIAERSTRVLAVVGALLLGAVAGLISARLAAGVVTVAVAIWLVLALLSAVRFVGAVRATLD